MGKGRFYPEDAMQKQVATLLDRLGWLWCHVPNGGKRGKVEAARFKGLGLKAGVPDVMVFESWLSKADGQCDAELGFGVAIELKAGKNGASAAQKAWMANLEARGWRVELVRSVAHAIMVLADVEPLNGRRLHIPDQDSD